MSLLLISAAMAASVATADGAGTPAHKSGPAVAAAAHEPPLPANAERLGHGRFKNIVVYRPQEPTKNVVLLLSGTAGWSADAKAGGVVELAKWLVGQGAMVVGIDTPGILGDFDHDGSDCAFPAGDLENLSHWVQAYYHLPTYRTPILVGYAAGGTLAYGALAQAPRDTFSGALSIGFCPDLGLHKKLCKGSGVESTLRKDGHGIDLLPSSNVGNPWTALQAAADTACPAAVAQPYAVQAAHGEVVTLPAVGHRFPPPSAWTPAFQTAYSKLAVADRQMALPPPPTELGDLPVVEVPATGNSGDSSTLAIIMSGDGGWAGLDQDVAKALTARGIPVVGLDSLRYYWTPRKPDGVAADVDKLVRYYLAHWQRKRALLVGYSQGADVMPFVLNRLPDATRSKIALGAALGLGTRAAFEFHVTNWVQDDSSGLPILPEVQRISGVPFLCIYGADEKDSLCPQLDPKRFKVVAMKGGHHFGGNYDELAGAILDAAGTGTDRP